MLFYKCTTFSFYLELQCCVYKNRVVLEKCCNNKDWFLTALHWLGRFPSWTSTYAYALEHVTGMYLPIAEGALNPFFSSGGDLFFVLTGQKKNRRPFDSDASSLTPPSFHPAFSLWKSVRRGSIQYSSNYMQRRTTTHVPSLHGRPKDSLM